MDDKVWFLSGYEPKKEGIQCQKLRWSATTEVTTRLDELD